MYDYALENFVGCLLHINRYSADVDLSDMVSSDERQKKNCHYGSILFCSGVCFFLS